jgi:hypothetical protein
MRKTVIFIIPLILLITTACSITIASPELHKEIGSGNVVTQQRDVSGFDQVKFGGVGILTITQGSQETLTIEADDNVIDHIRTTVFNNQLSITLEPNFNFTTPEEIHFSLSVKDLSRLELSGFGDIYLDKLKSDSFVIKLSGSGNLNLGEVESNSMDVTVSGFGNIDLDDLTTGDLTILLSGSGNLRFSKVQADRLYTTVSGFGSAELGGQINDIRVEIKGAGNFKGGDLHTQTADVTLSGLGGATVWTEQALDVNITGSGNVSYFGQPQITQKISGLGRLDALGTK